MKMKMQVITKEGRLKTIEVERQYKMITVWDARVDGRCFQTPESEERAKELAELLPKFYPTSDITITAKKKRRYI